MASGSEPKAPGAVGRDEAGRFLPGQSPHSGGRPALPPELKSRWPELIALQLRAALEGRMPVSQPGAGEVDADTGKEADGTAVRSQVVPAKVRAELAERLIDRVLGRAPQQVDLGDDAASVLLAILKDKA